MTRTKLTLGTLLLATSLNATPITDCQPAGPYCGTERLGVRLLNGTPGYPFGLPQWLAPGPDPGSLLLYTGPVQMLADDAFYVWGSTGTFTPWVVPVAASVVSVTVTDTSSNTEPVPTPVSPRATPEPASFMFLGTGLLMVVLVKMRRGNA